MATQPVLWAHVYPAPVALTISPPPTVSVPFRLALLSRQQA